MGGAALARKKGGASIKQRKCKVWTDYLWME